MAVSEPEEPRPGFVRARLYEPAGPTGVVRRNRLIVAAVFIAVGLVLFARVWDWWTEREDLSRWDVPVSSWLLQHRSPPLTAVLQVVTTVTAPTGMIIIAAVTVGAWLLRSRHWWRPLLLAAAMVVAVACIVGIKAIAGRGRPPIADMLMGADLSYSFPSGHTLGTATFLLVLAYLLFFRPQIPVAGVGAPGHRRGRWASSIGAVLIIVFVAFSRLYLGYHWLTDVTASVLLAVAILGVVIGVDTWRPTAIEPASMEAADHRG